jgi:hypothetical protein
MTAKNPAPTTLYRLDTIPEPPAELGEAGASLWRAILAEFVVGDAGGLAVLAEACAARDLAERLRRQIELEGDLVPGAHGTSKANPLISMELTARGLIARLLGRLGVLDGKDKRPPGRPPGKGY